jgi:hypothetical protein
MEFWKIVFIIIFLPPTWHVPFHGDQMAAASSSDGLGAGAPMGIGWKKINFKKYLI